MMGAGEKFFAILLVQAFLLSGHQAFSQQVEKISPEGTRFLLYTPPGYTQSTKHPLLIVLHGQGAMGDNLNKLRQRDQTPSMLIAQDRWPSRYPFIVVSPQLKRDERVPDPADQKWPPEMVDEVVEYVRSLYNVDASRMYITGLSQGGHGSYDYMVAHPEKIAAGVLISGVPDSTVACAIKDIPVWIFHGTDDPLVPKVFATGLVRALNACAPPGRFHPHLNMLYGHKHEGWNEVYNGSNGYEVFDWMLKFKKGDLANTPPYVSAGNDITLADRDQSVHLYGEVFDSDGTIADISWTQVSGPAVRMQNVHSQMLRLSDFDPGDYQFKLSARDNAGGRSEDVVTLKIVSSASGPAVTQLVLMNGKSEDIASLRDGYVIDPETLFRNQINIRATVSGNAGSVRFSVNSNGNARTDNDIPYLLTKPRWTVTPGEYRVCATPYSGRSASGTPGISNCYNIVVSTTATPTPEEPAEPEQPEPPAPEQPEPPTQEEPEPPVQPEEPDQPADPEQPDEPDQPGEPEQPEEPEPADPDEPGQPEDPEEPDEPGQPQDPGQPEEPEQPGQPDMPADPQQPETPETPQPEAPDMPQPPENDVVVPTPPTEVVTGLGERPESNMIFYPNPARDFIYVGLSATSRTPVPYAIHNAMGRQVLSGELPPEYVVYGIDIQELPAGIYFFRLRHASSGRQTRFIVE